MNNEYRPSWNEFWINLAKVYSTRSHDKNTKHGCVIVRKNKTLACAGYNGLPPGSDDFLLPTDKNIQGGHEKYHYINHAEENAILIAAKNGTSIDDCVAYITGVPCARCSRLLISAGIKEWHCGDVKHSGILDAKEIEVRNILLQQHNVKVHLYGDYNLSLLNFLTKNTNDVFVYHENFKS